MASSEERPQAAVIELVPRDAAKLARILRAAVGLTWLADGLERGVRLLDGHPEEAHR